MKQQRLLWADDEIDLLKPYVLFLREKGYDVQTATNGQDALDLCREQSFDLVFLDENMPGLSGLETLNKMKEWYPSLPIVMITKSEEENIMDQAIGNKIADYLIKPVNPNQILLTLKKNLHQQAIVNEALTQDYRQSFQELSMQISMASSLEDWKEVYRKLVHWELELEGANTGMDELLLMQKQDANRQYAKFVARNYASWMSHSDARPLMSPDLFRTQVFPALDKGEKLWFILIDNFRFDQWRSIKPLVSEYFHIDEQLFLSLLPTATQYSRNAIFSGLMPLDIQRMFPDLWVDEDEEQGKNLNEAPLIQTQLERYRKPYKFSYHKINDVEAGEKLLDSLSQYKDLPLNVVVFNFIDMLSHARTESKMIRELASSQAAYRSLTQSWYKHSPLSQLLQYLAEQKVKVILTTDHGTIQVNNAVKVVGDKNTNTNLRYKLGKSLDYNPKQVFEMKRPADFHLPSPNLSTTYIFAMNNDFFAYPNNYNHYVNYYRDTFQHGGISLEEMMIPLVTLESK